MREELNKKWLKRINKKVRRQVGELVDDYKGVPLSLREGRLEGRFSRGRPKPAEQHIKDGKVTYRRT